MKPRKDNIATSQGKRFVESARALECDESEERFDAALKKIAAHKPHKDTDKGAIPKPTVKGVKETPRWAAF
jgi:hypothetical protein